MKTILIIGAMPSELDGIIKKFSNAKTQEIAGFKYYIADNNSNRLVFACSGIAKVNSALCTQAGIDNFKPEAVINTGIAGGMDDKIKVCDIVISKSCTYHDLNPHFLNDYPPYCSNFKSDERLIIKACEVCDEINQKYFVGNIVSGEEFVTDSKIKKEIKDKFNPYAVDMETAAIAHCAYRNNVPFVSVRCISDNADDEGEMSFDKFEKIAADIVANIVIKLSDNI